MWHQTFSHDDDENGKTFFATAKKSIFSIHSYCLLFPTAMKLYMLLISRKSFSIFYAISLLPTFLSMLLLIPSTNFSSIAAYSGTYHSHIYFHPISSFSSFIRILNKTNTTTPRRMSTTNSNFIPKKDNCPSLN